VLDAGAGDLWELRSTDIDIAKCRRRYEVFKARPCCEASGAACGRRECGGWGGDNEAACLERGVLE